MEVNGPAIHDTETFVTVTEIRGFREQTDSNYQNSWERNLTVRNLLISMSVVLSEPGLPAETLGRSGQAAHEKHEHGATFTEWRKMFQMHLFYLIHLFLQWCL